MKSASYEGSSARRPFFRVHHQHTGKAGKPPGRRLIVEMVLPAGDAPHPGKMLDMVMLVQAGGQERTEAEYGSLLSKAGFRPTRVVPTDCAVGVVEAVSGLIGGITIDVLFWVAGEGLP